MAGRFWALMVVMLGVGVPASHARRGEADAQAAFKEADSGEDVRGLLAKKGWTPLEETSGQYAVGQLWSPARREMRGCVVAEATTEPAKLLEAKGSGGFVVAGGGGTVGVRGEGSVQAEFFKVQKLTDSTTSVIDGADMVLTDKCRDYLLLKRQQGVALEGWRVLSETFNATVTERTCKGKEALAKVRLSFLARGEVGGESSCSQETVETGVIAYRSMTADELLPAAAPAPAPAPVAAPVAAPSVSDVLPVGQSVELVSKVPDLAVDLIGQVVGGATTAPVTEQGTGITGGYQGAGSGGLGIAAQLAAQECDEKAKTLGETARKAKLDAAQASSQSGASADWGRMKPDLQLCVKLKRAKRGPCISQVQQWLEATESMSVTLKAGTEVVQTDCGPRSPAFAAQTRSFSATEVPAAQALLVQLSAADTAASSGGSNSIGMKFVSIAAGDFMMGSPSSEKGRGSDERQHRVRLTKSFLMATTEVTQGQWRAVMGSNPSYFSSCGADCPVEKVSWFDAVKFANALSKKEGLRAAYRISGKSVSWDKSANGYRLPTEAEWEYAARGGQRHVYSGSNALSTVGWTDENSGSKTHKVAGKRANAWGLYDMSGNVWEWCWDRYGESSGSSTDPVGPQSGVNRVWRGGSWGTSPAYARLANRSESTPDERYGYLGLRLVRTNPSPLIPILLP